MELWAELAIVLVRIVTILPLAIFMVLYMGKHSIGEIPVFDFLIMVVLGTVVGADISDPNIHHAHTVVAIVSIAILQRVISKLVINNRKVGKVMTFEPTIIMKDGQFLDQNMKHIRYSLDNILQMLRENNIFDISEVDTAMIEANGKMTVYPKDTQKLFFFPVVVEGTVYGETLVSLNLNEEWLVKQLADRGVYDIAMVFYAAVSADGQVRVSLKNHIVPQITNLRH